MSMKSEKEERWMFEHWKLKDFASGEDVKQGAYSQQFEMDDWIDVAVPGDVHQALIAVVLQKISRKEMKRE